MNAKPTPGKWKKGARVPERHAIRILDRRGFLVAEARGAGGPWTEVEGNAALIVAAVNACFQVDPSNPLAVAEALPEIVNALLRIANEPQPEAATVDIMRAIARAALAKIGATP